MKIALVMKEYSSERGGAEKYAVNLSLQLAQHGHEVHLFAHRCDGSMDSLKMHHVPMLRFPTSLKILSFALNASRCIKKGNYDIINGLTQVYPQDVYRLGGGIYRHWFRIKYPSFFRKFFRLLSPAHWVNLFLEDRIYKRGNFRKIITISQMDKELLQTYYHVPEDKVEVVYNGVDLNQFNPKVRILHREKVREELGIGKEEILLLFIGMNFARKGLRTIIESLSILKSHHPIIKLLVLGKDSVRPYEKMAKRLGVKDRVMFLGFTRHPEKYYGASDIFVFSSLYDSFANVHLEAMACGLPVITSKTAGGSELIKDGMNGFVLKDPLDSKELSRLIALCIPKRQEMGQEAANIARHFSVERNSKKMLGIYEEILREKESECKESSFKEGNFLNATSFIVNKSYEEFLRSHGLSDFQSMMNFSGGERVKVHRKGGKIAREVIRFSLQRGTEEKIFYLKRYLIPNAKDKLRSFLCLPSSIAEGEWKGAKCLIRSKVPTIIPVAMGEEKRLGMIDRAFFLSLSMDHAVSLEEFLERRRSPLNGAALAEKRELITQLALLFKKLHAEGIIYKDFLPKHIYIQKKDSSLQLSLIDLQRIKVKRYLGDGVRLKDLLKFKARLPKGSFSRMDEWRFLKAYGFHKDGRSYYK